MKTTATTDRARTRLNPPPRGTEFATRRIVISNPFGLHLRPVALFVRTMRQYEADVVVGRDEGPAVDGKSMLEVLTLGIQCGDTLTVAMEGPDAAEAAAAVETLFAGALGRSNADAMVMSNSAQSRTARQECVRVCA